MKYAFPVAAALLISATPVMAGGIDRSGQFLDPLWVPGNYAELSFGHVEPSVDGNDVAAFGGRATGNVTGSHNLLALAYKHQFTPNWSAAIILDSPFGADINYPATGSVALGGTKASVDGHALTGIVRFAMPEAGFGVHGGVRAARTTGGATLSGQAYGGVNGYDVDLNTDTAYGWLAGVSWERPDIAARVALTYNSAITHEFDSIETIPAATAAALGIPTTVPGQFEVELPKSWNLEFQTGINQQTLVFGSIRWVDWSSFKIEPPVYSNIPDPQVPGSALGSLTSLDDSTTYTLGAARKFTDNWSGAASFSFEKSGDNLVSPLAPTNGKRGITLAAIYTQDKLKVTTGISYVKLGDASAETGTPDTARAEMSDNSAWGIGVKIGYSF